MIAPDEDAEALARQSKALRRRGDLPGAIEAGQRALRRDPACGRAHRELGRALLAARQYPLAALHLGRALALRPDHPRLHVSYGIALGRLDRFEDAIGHFQQAVALQPRAPLALHHWGHALRRTNRLEESLEYFRRARALRPDFVPARYGEAVALIALGRLREGFAAYEGRWRRIGPEVDAPPWQGEDLAGRTILLYQEQGLGDTIQFLRYAPWVAERGGRVIVRCARDLVRLAGMVEGVRQVVTRADPPPAVDCHYPLMSLAYAAGSTEETLPAPPYLRVPPGVAWPLPPPLRGRPLRVGVVWAGARGTTGDHERTIPYERFAPLLDCPGVTFYSLQQGERAAARDGERAIDLGPRLGDMADTAAVIAQLDQVVACDTSVAHLAGALGREVWILLPWAPDFRWMLEREDTPWYPSARLFRQPRRGDWDAVVARVMGELAARAAR